MQISIGRIADDKRKINKTFSAVSSVDCKIYEPCNVLSPIFILSYNANFLTCNYAYCSAFGRYYYIDNITVDSGGKIRIQCSVDVLKSYANNILSLNTTVARNEHADPKKMVDKQMVITPQCNLSVIKAANAGAFNVRGASSFNYVLCIAGGAVGGDPTTQS